MLQSLQRLRLWPCLFPALLLIASACICAHDASLNLFYCRNSCKGPDRHAKATGATYLDHMNTFSSTGLTLPLLPMGRLDVCVSYLLAARLINLHTPKYLFSFQECRSYIYLYFSINKFYSCILYFDISNHIHQNFSRIARMIEWIAIIP